jgi:hypothetical protein
MLDAAEQYDYFGQALTTGDFDGDGYDDLAVGVTGEDSLGVIGAGAVHILEGGSAGLTVNGNQLLENHMTGNQYMAHYGSALAASDFDGDGFVDLAIGVPNYDLEISVSFDCGGVKVVYGTDDGLSTSRSQLWVQSAAWGLGEGVEQDDHFGASLAAGDFDGDGYADLAIGVPDEDVVYASTTRENAGYVNTLYGSQIGIRSAGVQGWHQDGVLVEDAPGAHERFGYALAAYPGTFHRIHLPIVLRND